MNIFEPVVKAMISYECYNLNLISITFLFCSVQKRFVLGEKTLIVCLLRVPVMYFNIFKTLVISVFLLYMCTV